MRLARNKHFNRHKGLIVITEEERRYNQIISFARTLPDALKSTFSWSNFFTNQQVKTAIEEEFSNLGQSEDRQFENVCYAFAMFCTQQEFDNNQFNYKGELKYEELRREVSDICSENLSDFLFTDLESLSSKDISINSDGYSVGFDGIGGGDI